MHPIVTRLKTAIAEIEAIGQESECPTDTGKIPAYMYRLTRLKVAEDILRELAEELERA